MGEPLLHLVCGPTGAGKTTHSLALAEDIGAVRFSIDEWMTALFWGDSPQPIDPEWAMARVERCYAQIWAVARQVATLGTPCVLDLGFTTMQSRQRFMELARAGGFLARLHFVDVPAEERWRRVERRNAQDGATRQLEFAVTREMFNFIESLWEPPSSAEMQACDGVVANSPAAR